MRGSIEAGVSPIVVYLTPPYLEGMAHQVAETSIEPLLAEFAEA